jgi:vancomycin permeability regulator SanA
MEMSRMLRWVFIITRSLGLALGVTIVLNLALALQRPGLSMTGTWLDAGLAEPWLSLFAGALALALLVPHEAARHGTVRWLLAGTFLGYGLICLAGTALYYRGLHLGEVVTSFPSSALAASVLIGEFLRVEWWRPEERRLPPPARVLLGSTCVALAFLAIVLVHVLSYGHRDHRREADAAVILGAKVYPDGSPSHALIERLETGLELYRRGLVPLLILSGGEDPNGRSEPRVMRDWVTRRGVPPSRVILDETGVNTQATAVACAQIARDRGIRSVLAVTQYFHCARVKMALEREGLACDTVPAAPLRDASGQPVRLSREGFFLLREVIAVPYYLIHAR